ncbi:fasciclin domain-containing protein [Algoriphagus winogradskyi]|uniref:Uncaracterized surface protein containing fasciclin (FAS1) repeats n=1 Tax=Algoriphagus winogradskyi TaxID=237017 RepID=A0ABY1P7Y1_9BACT|nr:fasciclin domain-containing protein [Algoriphagus winogradskyi]SMP27723.1 Uncaracterized surface protein containing fasciclin (FAS1) repeats [Algoriphagus winogradskyi]
MKKLGIVVMLTMLVIASSFAPKRNAVHETKIEADIVDLAISQDFLSTLVAAVKAGDLVDVLKGDGPFTVFAPTNDAFAKLPAGTVENLLKPENKAQLVKILTYHVVPGKVMSKDLSNGQMAKTVQGSSVKVTIMDGKVMIDKATVTAADIEADNGVVHVIDTVIMPSM